MLQSDYQIKLPSDVKLALMHYQYLLKNENEKFEKDKEINNNE
jgi:hypothetical protein